MITVRRIERLWQGHKLPVLIRELLQNRPEASMIDAVPLGGPAAAAVAIIRLDELSQGHVPLYRTLLRTILTTQEPDGGWGDLITTALCTRALLCGEGQGVAIERACAWLAGLQKSDGLWPHEPIRRLPADPLQSAFVLLQLGAAPTFRAAVRIDDASDWFERHGERLDPRTAELWSHARLRCRIRAAVRDAAMTGLWS